MKPKAIVKLVSEQSPEPVPSHGGPAVLTRWVLSIEDVILGQEHCRHKWSTDRVKYTRIDYAPRNLVDLLNRLCEKFDPPDASPAGVGVETPPPSSHAVGSEDGPCPYRKGDFLKCVKPTNFHRLGEIVLVKDTCARFAHDNRPYWVVLAGKTGHYWWGSFEKASPDEVAAALHPSPQPRAAVSAALKGDENGKT